MLNTLLNSRWALEPAYHDRIALVVLQRLATGKEPLPAMGEKRTPYLVNPAAGLTPVGYRRLEKVATRSGHVAILPIMGAMSRYGDMCSHGSEDMANWVREANADPMVSAIVLEINSPGGEVDGTEALGRAVKTSTKPVLAWVSGMAASAAYWVASQAKEIWMESESTSEVGSIGVLAVHVDSSQYYEKEGHKVTIVRSDGSEDKALFNSVEPLSDAVMTGTKEALNRIRGTFIDTVKSGRPGIAEDVFSGKMFDGKTAKKKKMADRFGGLIDAVKRADELARKQISDQPRTQTPQSNMLSKTLSSFFGVKADEVTDEQEKQVAAVVVSADDHKKVQGELTTAQARSTELETKLKAFGETDDARKQTLDDAGEWRKNKAQFETLSAWYDNVKKAGITSTADESTKAEEKPKRVSKVTQEAIDLKKGKA